LGGAIRQAGGGALRLQDEIVARLTNQLGIELVRTEARRSEKAPSPDTLDLFFQGAASLYKGPSLENLSRAKALFERVLTFDPDNVDALILMAFVDLQVAGLFRPDDLTSRLAAAEAAATKALSLAPEDARVHWCMGAIFGVTKRTERAIAECERALSIDPTLADAHADIGCCKAITGHPEQTEAHVREALRLSPRDLGVSIWMSFMGLAKNLMGQHEEAILWFQRSIEAGRTNAIAHFNLAGTLALAGRLEEARAAAAAGLALHPHFIVARFLSSPWSDHPSYLAGRKLIADGMRMARIPEGDAKTT
jgi:tetratricopeptide (TPR) repeat protein